MVVLVGQVQSHFDTAKLPSSGKPALARGLFALTWVLAWTYNGLTILLGETMILNRNCMLLVAIVASVFAGSASMGPLAMGPILMAAEVSPQEAVSQSSSKGGKDSGGIKSSAGKSTGGKAAVGGIGATDFGLGLGLDLAGGGSDTPYEVSATYSVERGAQKDGAQKGRLTVTVQLFGGYHIFSTTQGPGGPTPTAIKIVDDWVKMTGPLVPSAPPEIEMNSEFWPGLQVEQFHDSVTWTAPLVFDKPVSDKPTAILLTLTGQVCEKNCIPIRDDKFEASFSGFTEVEQPKGTPGVLREDDSPVEWNIQLSKSTVKPGESLELILSAATDPEFHIYKLDPNDETTENRTLLVVSQKAGVKVGAPVANKRSVRKDMGIGTVVDYYEGPVQFRIPIEVPETAVEGETPLEGLLGYQACTNGACDRPRGLNFKFNYNVSRTTSDPTPLPAVLAIASYEDVASHPQRSKWIDGPKYALTLKPFELFTKFCLAMIAGFILNFMPCVLPVIGLKILGFVNEAHGDKGRASLLTLIYAAGMIGFVLAFGIASILVRTFSDQTLGWGSQFGNTTFQIVITSFMFALALSFLGVWEFPIPGFATGSKSTELSSRHGFIGAFSKGVITTLLATPCSGPFLGSALAVSLTQPAWVVLLIFLGVGLGMASPYLVISVFPSALKWIPKPGPWMETFKELLAFPLLLSVVIFINGFPQSERTSMLSSLIFTWFACWLIGRVPAWASSGQKLRAWGLGTAAVLAGTWGSFFMLGPSPYELEWEPFSEQRLQQLVREGKTVMVDFTAEWCNNCKTNLAFAIHTRRVHQIVRKNEVVPMIADLTRYPPELMAKLKQLGYISIPIVAIYPAGEPDSPIVLEDLLVESDVVRALERAGPSHSPENKSLPTSMGETQKEEIR
jgi:thiol:disulfide interchange protein